VRANTLERQPEEAVVDPWVAERTALVAVERDAVVAAAYLKRFRDDDDVAPPMANAGSIEWLVFWPHLAEAGEALMASAAWPAGPTCGSSRSGSRGVAGAWPPGCWPRSRAGCGWPGRSG
jgi:hypothetical protein